MSEDKKNEATEFLYHAMTIGEELLACGAEVSRVEDTIRRICMAFGAERVDVFTITSSIVVTISSPEYGVLTQTRRIRGTQYDLHRLEMLNQLSRKICAGSTVPDSGEIRADIQRIQQEKGYSFVKSMLMYAVVSASFTMFFGGSVRDAVASGMIGLLLKLLQSRLNKQTEIPQFLNTFICSIVGGLLAMILVTCGLGQSFDKISIGNIMLLIPGIALTNGVRDMFSGDMISGVLRFVEALLLAAVIAFAFVLISIVIGGEVAWIL